MVYHKTFLNCIILRTNYVPMDLKVPFPSQCTSSCIKKFCFWRQVVLFHLWFCRKRFGPWKNGLKVKFIEEKFENFSSNCFAWLYFPILDHYLPRRIFIVALKPVPTFFSSGRWLFQPKKLPTVTEIIKNDFFCEISGNVFFTRLSQFWPNCTSLAQTTQHDLRAPLWLEKYPKQQQMVL